MTGSPDEVEALRAIQARRAAQEAQAGASASDPAERHAHERRAEKAAYLRKKLDEQAHAPDG